MADPVLIIPTLGAPHLADCIESLDVPVRLLVIANGHLGVNEVPGVDYETPFVAYDQTWLIDLPHNIGYAAAVNLGIKCYPAEPFWLIANDDVILAPGDLSRLIADERYGWTGINDWSVQKLTADTVERIGWMDEAYHPAYCDDADYERRCDLAGVPRGFIEGATTHAGSACLRDHRDDNGRTYPLNVLYHRDKWGVGVREAGGYPTPWNRPATPPDPPLSRLRAQAWRPDG